MPNNRIVFFILIFLTIFSFGLRVYRITEPNHYYFDEVYHAVTAKAYADDNPASYDPFSPAPKEGTAYDWLHPPLAKLIQAGSIKIFGDEPLGWRLPSVIFGTAIIPATFVLAYLLFGPLTAIFTSTVIAFENLTFAMSRITMNDVFVTFFILMSFIFAFLYVRQNKTRDLFLTALFLGLAFVSKWSGLYAIAVIFVYLLWHQVKSTPGESFRRSLGAASAMLKLVLLIVIPVAIYLLAYGQYWFQGHSISQFTDLHKQIWWYQNRRDLEHSYGTTPLYCVPKGLDNQKTLCPWVLNARGVYFSYEGYKDEKAGYIYALGNPLIFWAGLAAVGYLILKFVTQKKKEYALVLLGYFIFWVPWIFAPRILFLYHYLPSIPFLSIALGIMLTSIYRSRFKFLSIAIVLIFALVFFYFYPISSGYPIDKAAIDKYMWISTWR